MALTAENRICAGATLSAKEFGLLTSILSSVSSGIVSGCTVTVSSNTIKIAEGYILVDGRLVYVPTGSTTIALPTTTTTYYLYAKVDLANAGKATIEYGTSIPSSDSDFPINPSGKAYCRIAQFKATTSALSSVVMAPLIGENSAIGRWQRTGHTKNVELSKADTYYDVGSITLSRGGWLVYGWGAISGFSGGTGTSTIQLYNKTTDSVLRTMSFAHTLNATLSNTAIRVLDIPRHGTDLNNEIILRASTKTAGRSVTNSEITAIRLY